MASMEMKNLRSFPIAKLCFDLKLEALEQMEPRDVCELAKVNQGFQGMLVRDPSIVFGEHVYRIHFDDDGPRIMKFSNSIEMELNFDRPFSHFSFVKKIRSCDRLRIINLTLDRDHQFNEKYTLLKNLKSVNRLGLRWISKETLERFFSNFHASIKEKAELDIDYGAFDDQMMNDWIENFMLGPQLKDCEKVWLDCRTEDSVRFYYNALSKSETKNVLMRLDSGDCSDLIIQQIITNGIPSKHPEAAICLDVYNFAFPIDLSQYPGMRRIDGENRLRLLKQANYLWSFGYYGRQVKFCMEESSIFCRRFDSGKDCIYVYDDDGTLLAFYVPVDKND